VWPLRYRHRNFRFASLPALRQSEAYSVLELVMPCQAYSRNRYRPTRPQPANPKDSRESPGRRQAHASRATGRCPNYQVPGRGSGHSEHRPEPARTEVSPSARPNQATTDAAHRSGSLFNYHDNCFEGIDQQASNSPRCIPACHRSGMPEQRMIALVKPLGLLVLLG
jgi:hypothetical protein